MKNPINSDNLFENIPDDLSHEISEILIDGKNCRIERILSKGHASPQEEWYDQDENEWVLLIRGSAGLKFEDRDEMVKMAPGDHINIPSHRRHRVEWTDPEMETIWLVVFY
ncbi:MAG: cupin domain-containing protein [Deltaproteobacteria bacterium]|nr:cupin domain-containing protein [Deltaproteobacteria bacterium]